MMFHELTAPCYHCEGHGVIQKGSLAGNECTSCEGGRTLTPEGQTIAALIARYIRESQ